MTISKVLKAFVCLFLGFYTLYNDAVDVEQFRGITVVDGPEMPTIPNEDELTSSSMISLPPAEEESQEQAQTTMPEAAQAMPRHKLLADALIAYAHEASKTLENIPSLVNKTKVFIDDSLALIARIKNDLEKSHAQIKLAKNRADCSTRLTAITILIDQQLIPAISHLSQLSLTAAELIYAMNNELLEPFNTEVASRGMNTAVKIREMVKSTNALTDTLHDMIKNTNGMK